VRTAEYIQRELERKFLSMSSVFKAIMVTGARQVGKSTMLRHLAAGQNRTYVSMDNARDRELAQADPKLFFQTYKPPVLIEQDGVLHPLEIKKTAEPDRRAVKVFGILQKANRPVGAGGIVCMTDAPYPVEQINSFIPANLI
jgi:hypothetical protein